VFLILVLILFHFLFNCCGHFVDWSYWSIIQQSNSCSSQSLNCRYQWPDWLIKKVRFLQQESFIHFFNYITYMQASLIYNNVNVHFMLLYYILWLHFSIQDTVIHFVITRWAALVNLVRLHWWGGCHCQKNLHTNPDYFAQKDTILFRVQLI
jgi:hypothetical protein